MAVKNSTVWVFVAVFEKLFETRSIESITVHDITEAAGLSRTTFYRYFKDKYDLMNQVYQIKVDGILAKYPDLNDWQKWMFEILEYLYNKADFFEKALKYQDQNAFSDFYYDYSITHLTQLIKETHPAVPMTPPQNRLKNWRATSAKVCRRPSPTF